MLNGSGQLGRGLIFTELGQHLIDVGVGLDIKIDAHTHDSVIGADGVHVIHVVHSAHLFLDGGGDGFGEGLGVAAEVSGLDADLGRDDVG